MTNNKQQTTNESKKMTPTQKKHLAQLRNGAVLVCDPISGYWRLSGYPNRRLRIETQEALRNTGELVEIVCKGRALPRVILIAHESQADKVLTSRPNLKQIALHPTLSPKAKARIDAGNSKFRPEQFSDEKAKLEYSKAWDYYKK